MARKAGSEHFSVTMDTTDLEAGTVGLLPLQGRGVVNQVDMDTLGEVLEGLLALEHNPLEAADRCFLLGQEVPDGGEEVV